MEIINNIGKSIVENQYFLQIIASFLGAFFSFLFFLLGLKIKNIFDKIKNEKNELAYLERYFGSVQQSLFYNKGLLDVLKKSINKKEINIMDLTFIPKIERNSSLKIHDLLYINRLEKFILRLKTLNLTIENFNKLKNITNSLIISKDPQESLQVDRFIEEIKELSNILDYHKFFTNRIIIENRILSKKIRNFEYNKEKIIKNFNTRKKEIEEESKIDYKENNPLIDEENEILKKFKLIDTDD